MKKKIFLYLPKIIMATGLLSAGVWYVFFSGYFDTASIISEKQIPVKNEIENITVTAEASLPSIFVHICGEVLAPSVYEVPAGSRVVDVVNIAGGFTDKADTNYLNLARPVVDSERIYVPCINDRVDSAAGENGETRVNINTASLEELVTLPGIGEARAKDIISYRTNVGKFERIEDIKNVSGIGDAMFTRMKSYISVR